MKIGFNGASTMKTDLAGDIKAVSQAGYDWLEIWAKKMEAYLSKKNIHDLKELFKKWKIKPLSINSVEFVTFNAPWEKINTINLIQRYAEIADQLHCPYLVLVPSPRPPEVSDQEIFEESVKILREISNKFRKYKVKFAFEFLGFSWCSVSTLEQSVKIVKSVNRNNIGFVLDTFHFYVGGSSLESIVKVDQDKLYIIHINDAENRPKENLQDAHRLFPGEGVIPLQEIMNRLKEIHYDGPVSIEMFRPEYWIKPAEEVAKKGMEAIKKFL